MYVFRPAGLPSEKVINPINIYQVLISVAKPLHFIFISHTPSQPSSSIYRCQNHNSSPRHYHTVYPIHHLLKTPIPSPHLKQHSSVSQPKVSLYFQRQHHPVDARIDIRFEGGQGECRPRLRGCLCRFCRLGF